MSDLPRVSASVASKRGDHVGAVGAQGRASLTTGVRSLQVSAMLWFIVAVTGQWFFVAYLLVYYGARLAGGGLAALSETTLRGGYVPGAAVGNVAVASHVLLAILIQGGGPLQLVPAIRKRAPVFHHWTGRIFLVAVVLNAISGLYMNWVRGIGGGALDVASNTVVALFVFAFAAQALRHAMAREIGAHRRWALRLFLVSSAVWFVRVGVYGSVFLADQFGIDFGTISSQVFAVMNVAKLLVPLGLLELYFWAQRRAGSIGRIAVASVLVTATAVMGLGIYAVTTLRWLPRMLG